MPMVRVMLLSPVFTAGSILTRGDKLSPSVLIESWWKYHRVNHLCCSNRHPMEIYNIYTYITNGPGIGDHA